tara:strand:+ start:1787 stop:2752 length:966 start_codon:yes stop_codon:yes gene_type:complete
MENGILKTHMHKKNNSIAFISSPFQLLCLKEFIEEKKIKTITINFIQVNKSEENVKQINLTAKFLGLEIIKNFYIKKFKLNYINYLLMFFLKKVNFLVVGSHFNSHFVFLSRIIRFKNLFILDDGIATIMIGENQKKLIARSFTYNLYPKNRIYFTLFKSNNLKNYIINNFTYTKNLIYKKKYKNVVIILGGPLAEGNFVSHKEYESFILNIKNKFSNKTLHYLPHRLENINKLSKLNLEIDQSNFGFEIYLALNEFLPKIIIGFYSTALITTKILLKNDKNVRIFNYEIESLNQNYDWHLQSLLLEKYDIEKFNTTLEYN